MGFIRADFVGFDEAIEELGSALDEELPHGMLEAATLIADRARADHTFQNRTGDLERFTAPGQVSGDLGTSIEAQVLGDTEYGGFVEEGTSRSAPYPFLEPAAELEADDAARAADESMQQAADRAGWKK